MILGIFKVIVVRECKLFFEFIVIVGGGGGIRSFLKEWNRLKFGNFGILIVEQFKVSCLFIFLINCRVKNIIKVVKFVKGWLLQYFQFGSSFLGFLNDIVFVEFQMLFLVGGFIQIVSLLFSKIEDFFNFFDCWMMGWGRIFGSNLY